MRISLMAMKWRVWVAVFISMLYKNKGLLECFCFFLNTRSDQKSQYFGMFALQLTYQILQSWFIFAQFVPVDSESASACLLILGTHTGKHFVYGNFFMINWYLFSYRPEVRPV